MSSKNFMSYEDATTVLGAYAEAIKNKQSLTAGNYISIANDGTINVTQGIGVYDVYSYKFEGRVQSTNYWTDIIKSKNGIQQSSTRYSNTQAATPINIDDRFTLKYGLGTDSKWHVTLLVDSNEHQAGEEITWSYNETKDFTETFNVSQDSSTDLATKGDVNTAIAGKQDVLTAGDDIKITGSTIAVECAIETEEGNTYLLQRESVQVLGLKIIKKHGDTVISTDYYDQYQNYNVNYDGRFSFVQDSISTGKATITLLKDSTVASSGTVYQWNCISEPSISSIEFEAEYDRGSASEFIKDLQDEVATKQDTLTFDDVPTANSNNPVKSGGVKSAIDAAVSSAYHHAGTKTCVELVAGLLVVANEGNVYNMTDSGTTTADFIDGAGQPIKAGDNVGIAKISDGVYKFDLLSGFVDTSNFVQKSVTAGLLKNDGTVDTTIQGDISSLKSGFTNLDNEVNGDATTYPYADVITIPDAVPANLADCKVKIEPVQDLHGYDKPWVGGAGKNKLPLVLDVIKTLNTQGTWNGNTYTLNGASFTFNTDNGGNITSITVPTGTTTGATGVVIGESPSDYLVENTGYSINGCPAGGSAESSYYMCFASTWTTGRSNIDEGQGSTIASFNPSDYEGKTFRIAIRSGYTIPTGGLTFYPMLRLATETDSTFAPYTNVCPISGHTEVDVQRTWSNICPNGTDWSKGYIAYSMLKEDGTIEANEYQYVTEFFKVNGGDTYTASQKSTFMNSGAVCFYDKDKNYISGQKYSQRLSFSIIAPNNAVYARMSQATQSQNMTWMNSGSVAYEYEPYQGKTYTIALGDTIYGGTVDFDSGVMTVTHGIVDLGSLSWTKYQTVYYAEVSDSVVGIEGELPSIKCSCYKTVTTVTGQTQMLNKDDASITNNASYNRLYVKDTTNYADATEFTTAMDGMTATYELATPTTIQLTPQQIQLLKGQNTLTASTGDISVTVNGVSGAIGAVQEQVNDHEERIEALESGLIDLSTIHNVLSIPANTYTTYAEAYEALYSAFVNMPNTVKVKAMILRGNDIFINHNSVEGVFSATYLDYDSGWVISHESISLIQKKSVKNTTNTSSNAQSIALTLCY